MGDKSVKHRLPAPQQFQQITFSVAASKLISISLCRSMMTLLPESALVHLLAEEGNRHTVIRLLLSTIPMSPQYPCVHNIHVSTISIDIHGYCGHMDIVDTWKIAWHRMRKLEAHLDLTREGMLEVER